MTEPKIIEPYDADCGDDTARETELVGPLEEPTFVQVEVPE